MSDELKAEIASLRKELEAERGRSLQAEVMAELGKESHRIRNAGQFYRLFVQDGLTRGSDGRPVVKDGDVELPIARVIDSVKGDPENQHHFVQPEKPAKSDGAIVNPWMKGSVNLTRQAQIFRSNPELARKLEAQAKAAG